MRRPGIDTEWFKFALLNWPKVDGHYQQGDSSSTPRIFQHYAIVSSLLVNGLLASQMFFPSLSFFFSLFLFLNTIIINQMFPVMIAWKNAPLIEWTWCDLKSTTMMSIGFFSFFFFLRLLNCQSTGFFIENITIVWFNLIWSR
jgi:hypothetical protein